MGTERNPGSGRLCKSDAGDRGQRQSSRSDKTLRTDGPLPAARFCPVSNCGAGGHGKSCRHPEQACGKLVDKRTDIWAFGCVLYEMLTGRAPFARDTTTDSLAAILEREPNWQALPPAAMPLKGVLQRCPEKDVTRRFRDIGDVKLLLEDADSTRVPSTMAPLAVASKRPWSVAAALGLIVGVMAGALLCNPESGRSRNA